MQNFGIAFLIVLYNFPHETDHAVVALLSIGVLTTIPLYVALIILAVRDKIKAYRTRNRKTESAQDIVLPIEQIDDVNPTEQTNLNQNK
jgi:hypothetical protein